MSIDIREQSKRKWNTSWNNFEALNCGAILRIADATEVLSKNYAELANQRDRFKDSYEYERRAAISLRGQITKLKKKLKAKTNSVEV